MLFCSLPSNYAVSLSGSGNTSHCIEPYARRGRPRTQPLFGQYHFTKMPFGISSAPEHFQKRMMTILSGLEGVLCLIDDVLIFAQDEKEHDERLNLALKRIEEASSSLPPYSLQARTIMACYKCYRVPGYIAISRLKA